MLSSLLFMRPYTLPGANPHLLDIIIVPLQG